MKVFAVDTTRKIAKIYIFDSEKDSFIVKMDKNLKHSEGLFLYIEKILFDAKLTLSDIDVFACITGPGSFTGIRIGAATIKAFNKVCDKKTIAVTNFEVLSKFIKNGYVLLESTMSSCYYAEVKGGEILSTGVVEKSKINELVDKKQVVILEEEQEAIGLEYNNIVVVNTVTEKLREVIFEKINNDEFGTIEPYYLQLSQAERNLKND